VAAETSITQQRETIARKERLARQFDLMERYFAEADRKLQATPLASELIAALAALTTAKYEGIDPEAEWVREVVLRLQADIASFSSALASFGIRNEARVARISSRDPARLAAFGAGGAILLLSLIAFARASLRTSRSEVEEAG
jgi:primosomal protein N''